jgi:hypothetical protein
MNRVARRISVAGISDNGLMKLRFRGFYVIIGLYRHTSTTAEGIEGAKLRFLRMEEGTLQAVL